ncbi:tripartite motif-containing protein 2-like [Saccostrea echinata]|uniref:tripartite motif-containing protein 2-like n=1 Tax=Saccostrea echinata TaxID=191078 RepID=UPI002A835C05|nr:tripartite motif-containing protein 2-like [Saccostrea echinata]
MNTGPKFRPVSAMSLRTKIREDHLTCPICFGEFDKPKALPCLHSFCQGCLTDFIVSRGYESSGQFPCPVCQKPTMIPLGGVSEFPDNHLLSSLSDTVVKKPMVPPRPKGSPIDGSLRSVSPVSGNLYPQAPSDIPSNVPATATNAPCNDDLLLRFGHHGTTIADFMKPYGLTVGKNGEYVVTDLAGSRVLVFANAGELIGRFSCDCKISGVTMTRDNLILLAINGAGSAIMRLYNMDGHVLQTIGDYYRFDKPSGIAITSKNQTIISNLEGNNIYVFTDQNKMSVKFGWHGSGDKHFDGPNFIAVDSKDHIIVSDSGNNCIKVFDTAGNFKRKFGNLCCPMGVAVDKRDNVIVADAGNFRVQVFDNHGNYQRSLVQNTDDIAPDVKPLNVAVTRAGNVAVMLRGTQFSEIRVYKWLS